MLAVIIIAINLGNLDSKNNFISAWWPLNRPYKEKSSTPTVSEYIERIINDNKNNAFFNFMAINSFGIDNHYQ